MRTTITLDPDVTALVEREMGRRKVPFKVAINDALRRGLTGPVRTDWSFPTHDLGSTTHDLTKIGTMVAELEDERIVQKLNEGR